MVSLDLELKRNKYEFLKLIELSVQKLFNSNFLKALIPFSTGAQLTHGHWPVGPSEGVDRVNFDSALAELASKAYSQEYAFGFRKRTLQITQILNRPQDPHVIDSEDLKRLDLNFKHV